MKEVSPRYIEGEVRIPSACGLLGYINKKGEAHCRLPYSVSDECNEGKR